MNDNNYVTIINSVRNIEYLEQAYRKDVVNLMLNNSVFSIQLNLSDNTFFVLDNNKLSHTITLFSCRTQPAKEHEIIAARLKGEI